MARNKSPGTLLITLLFAYVLYSLPVVYSLLVIVSSILGASVLKQNQELVAKMFAYFARILTTLFRPNVRPSALRSDIMKVCASINNYPVYMNSILHRKKQLFFMLEKSQQKHAVSTHLRLKEIEKLIQKNSEFLNAVKKFALKEFNINEVDLYSVQSSGYGSLELLEHFVRDWSVNSENVASRKLLTERFMPWMKNKKRILVPGSGLGRLAMDISNSGVPKVVDAPELSAAMFLGSKFAAAQAGSSLLTEETTSIYPYLYHFSHWRNGSDQLEAVPLQFTTKGSANFVYQNFLNLNPATKYDAVSTLFFIDTAQNIFEYIEHIHNVLEKGGIWCNYGPMKWGSAAYAELSVDELLAYIKDNGWKILELWDDGTNRYNGSNKSMLDTKYKLTGWVARKK